MVARSYDKVVIAVTQLETALRLYDEGADLFSVITLAGAAEEILGKLVAAGGGEPTIKGIAKAASAISKEWFNEIVTERAILDRANRARNSLKHVGDDAEPAVTFDAREEAHDMLTRAIDNHWQLKHSLTPVMKSFTIVRRDTNSDDG